MASWIGCSVSINCGPTLGCYQGKISKASGNQITLQKPFRNGTPYPQPEVTLCSSDIVKLSIIDEQIDIKQPLNNEIIVLKPAKKNIMSVSDALTTSHTEHENNKEQPKVKGVVVNSLIMEPNSGTNNSKVPSNKNVLVKWDRKKTKEKNYECFGSSSDRDMDEDFDFEKNLALFDKQAIWNKINASQPDLVRQAGDTIYNPIEKKYRHNENVIATVPVSYRPISIPPQQQIDEQPPTEYVTDDGLIIPSISTDTRNLIFRVANNAGLSHERNSELMGRAVTEISLQLLGGGRRLNPLNSHQSPVVVTICGNGRSGSFTMNATRQLASHGVKTVVMKISSTLDTSLEKEHAIYKLTGHKSINKIEDLPRPDLILVGFIPENLASENNTSIKNWIHNIRAPVLAIDPPVNGYKEFNAKYSIAPMLPLSYTANNGKLYLCNLGLPEYIFTKIGIKYKSPFGSKFVIPLYSNDD